MVERVLIVGGLKVNFYTYAGVVRALDGIDFDLRPNETHGLVGETGCGKSVTVNSLLKLIPMPPGKIESGRALLHAPVKCRTCRGKGCSVCSGSGTLDVCEVCTGTKKCVGCRGFGRYKDGKTCRACEASGLCSSCGGSGSRYLDLLALSTKRMREIRGGSVSLILQEPMSALNPVLTVAEQVGEAFYYHQRADLVRGAIESIEKLRAPSSARVARTGRIRTPWMAATLGALIAGGGAVSVFVGSLLLLLGSVWGAALVPLGIIAFAFGLGVVFLREWARRLALYVQVLASAVYFLAPFVWWVRVGGLAWGLLVAYLLTRPTFKRSFQEEAPGRLEMPVLRLYVGLYRRMLKNPDSRFLQVLRKVPLIRRYHRWVDREARSRALEALRMVRIPSPEKVLDSYPHELSGGMMQRVVISIALASRPRILIADEPTTALDVTIQSQILRLMADLKGQLGTAIVFITHDLAVIAQVCDRVSVMYAGTIAESAPTLPIFREPLHPYTRGLVRAIPGPHEDVPRLPEIFGSVPNLVTPPPGCRFHPRCPFAKAVCKEEKPQLWEARPAHRVACHMYGPYAEQWTDADRLLPVEVLAR